MTKVFTDLSAVDFIDSSGVHALVTAHHPAKARGRHVYAINATESAAPIAVSLAPSVPATRLG